MSAIGWLVAYGVGYGLICAAVAFGSLSAIVVLVNLAGYLLR
jgi:hypothetical protein